MFPNVIKERGVVVVSGDIFKGTHPSTVSSTLQLLLVQQILRVWLCPPSSLSQLK